jgi:UDP-glucose 4-epimerase
MKSVVTGGAGFIGSHIVDLLIERGHDVMCLDNFESGNIRNTAHHQMNSRFTLLNADIRDKQAINNAFVGADYVFHLAGIADLVPSIEDPGKYVGTNVTGTLNVLESARAAKVRKIVYAASSSSYGIPLIYPTPEQAPIDPKHPYALTKRMGEELVLHWGQVYGISAISLRLFNVYGRRSRTAGAYGAVFGVFLAQKLNGKPFTVVGDGKQTRDFTHVTDVARAFVMAAESNIANEVFNVGSGNHYSVNRLVELLAGPVVYLPKRPGEPDHTFGDVSKIRQALQWKPVVSIDDGVKEMLEHIEEWGEAPLWDRDSIAMATEAWFKYLT